LKTQLLIFPFNGNGLEALDALGDTYELAGFVDDTPGKQGVKDTYSVFSREAFTRFPHAKVLAVPGSPASFRMRAEIIAGLNIPEHRFATIIHPRATVSPNARIGYNSLIMAGVVITSNAEAGNHICVLPNSVIHHDVRIGDYTLIGSNVTIAGHTTIGNECYIGSGSSIINGINIGNRTLIGMAANVIRSAGDNRKLAGNPAREL
jgi:sugar O-acyltransferase (sialic acid O-acetyltransferase NeuD family)